MVRDESTPGAAPDANGTQDSRRRAVDRVREPLPTHVDATPELPSGYHDALDTGLAAIGLDLPASVRTAIDGHVRLLLAWTAAINLTAVRDPVAVATSHVLDSLTAVALLRSWGVDRILDLGSGGGLPGIPLALALPANDALLVEPIGKKARFLHDGDRRHRGGRPDRRRERAGGGARPRPTASRTLAGRHGPGRRPPPPTSSSWPSRSSPRAAGSWPGSAATCARNAVLPRSPSGRWVAAPSRSSRSTRPASTGHRLLVATRDGRVADTYPRDPAARKRRPW